ncbi:variant erythrocyte surface antigen-1 family protein, partial [Babesia divergens]
RTRLVCCMYYTDVFVGQDNIDNLKNALKAELKDSGLNDELTQLVHGLCLFMGYPSCLCKPKKSVGESLEKISKELKEELQNYKCPFISNPKPSLNCDSCSTSHVVCKCCVLDCISKVLNCGCVQGSRNDCSCSKDDPKRCCKDLLEKLKASLSLLNLKADLETLCSCNAENCCVDGTCTSGSPNCSVCSSLKASSTSDYTITGLGLLRPSPKRLAERLENFFGDSGRKGSKNCSCQCNGSTPGQSCCCLACDNGKCFESCTAGCGSKCSSQPSPCPCKEFCQNINSIKVLEKSSDMRCCKSGAQCHCEVEGSKFCSPSPGQKCCVVDVFGGNFQQGVKCMIRRLVRFFKDLETSSKKFKSCCDLLCVAKTCYFLWDFYNKGGKEKCKNCKSPGTCKGSTLTPASSNTCCGGNPSKCQSGDCCLGCQDCDAIKFRKALQDLKYSSPCGQELYRTLDSFLNFIRFVFYPRVKDLKLENKIRTARNKCDNCKSGHSSCLGCKSGSSSCQGCTAVLKELRDNHKDLLSLMTRGSFSSYDSSEASWPSLPSSRSGSKCCGSSGSCSSCLSCSSPGSCPSQCCPDCPQRKAAKIFLGMLPCLYYGLKIVFDRSKYNSGFAGWHDITMDSDGKPESALAKFLYAWGFQTIESSGSSTIHLDPLLQAMVLPVLLENLFSSESSGNFDKIYKEVSKKYFSKHVFTSTSDSPPTTVREMLLWLYGLPYTSGFHDLVSRCKDLCSPSENSFHPDAFCYYIYTCCFIVPISIISFIEDSDSALSLISSSSDWKSFSYPSDPSTLADMLFKYVRKIYIPLHFLRFQCSLDKDKAGWQNCYFGRQCSVNSGSVSSASTSGCGCKGHDKYLCTGSSGHSGKCSAASSSASSCSSPCPHPLQRFLTATSDSPSSDPKSLFALPGTTPMGFESSNLSSTAKSGYDLYAVLHVFCESGFYPLTRLVQFALCISRYPPETLGELFGFFRKFISSDVFTSKFASYVDGEPGTYSGEDLKIALKRLLGSSHSGSHPSDLKSLSGCSSTKPLTCGKYLCSLTEYAYNIFIENFLGTYLSFVCYLAPTFEEELKEFQGEFSDCCSSGSCKIVECPCAHPFLYSYGFTFWSPNSLSGNSTKCSDFIEQLGKVVDSESPLQKLLNAIDAFLWHIRFP